ncbi:response regulator transcription factor [Paraflavisolibacter sp. H34]|uniref:response regulator transcription factor n=1 Tax=Huijunlia imazamoxiresistens TaxID=3127457 RepID=UPI0030187648
MLRILIADDHAIIRRGLKQILSEEYPSAEFAEATDAEAALKKIIQQEFDVLICDLSMPGRNGLEVVKQVKQHRPRLPVLILSIHPEEQYAVRSLRAGAAGYLNKDVATEELVKAVQRVLQGRKYISSSMAEKLAEELDRENQKPPHEQLSDRELSVFKLLAEGKAVSEIAELLALSATTISTYRARVLTKMNMKANAELTRYALENHLI